ncbi:MAG TPA: hypothetical protein VEI26_11710 [Terriglobales bacterium]|nr:hypothetical protein [Terriglobales bacterium]
MQTQGSERGSPSPQTTPAIEHVSSAHELLQSLRKRIGEHPELAEAIVKLETALSILTVKTGGML